MYNTTVIRVIVKPYLMLSANKEDKDQNALVGLSINLCLLFLIHVPYMS